MMRTAIVATWFVLATCAGVSSAYAIAYAQVGVILNPAVPGCVGCTLSGANTYEVYLQVNNQFANDSFGIVAYGFAVRDVSSLFHRSQRASNVDDSAGSGKIGPAGFSNLRSGNNATAIGNCPGAACDGFFIGATQDTTTPT